MKRAGAIFLLVLFLSGCTDASSELNRCMELRSKLLKAETVNFSVDITADYGDKVHTFSMDCVGDAQGNMTFTVTAPETISGITGKIADGDGSLTFDDTALHFELLTDDMLSPVSAPWILLKTLRSGYLTAAGMEEDQLRLTIDDSYEDDALQLDIWLDGGDLPVRAEILHDGRNILSLTVTKFEIL